MEQGVTECRERDGTAFGNGDDLVRELRYMESQMQVGVPVEQLFWNLGQRSGVEEIRNFGDIFLIARRSGGNLRENSWESGRSIGREDTGHRGDSGSDRRKEAGTAGDEYGSGSDDPLYAGDFQRISGCLIS